LVVLLDIHFVQYRCIANRQQYDETGTQGTTVIVCEVVLRYKSNQRYSDDEKCQFNILTPRLVYYHVCQQCPHRHNGG
jgi:hypothetical protein